ncbi:hypothetical protein I311_05759 [Cryptococcus gattii NT-10]|nr:hypothetical protein I311_05759 [Cryptococcus gattii NT-10]
MPLFAFLQNLLCRTDTAPCIDPLPAGYSSMSVASNILGPTFVPLQLPPDGHLDPGTFKDITEIYSCIRDYSEQILTRWLNTYANHTAALRQLQQAGLYPPHSVVVRDVTPANVIPTPGTSETQPDSAQSKQAIPPPLPEKTKSFPNPPQTSFQVPPKPLPPLKCEDSRPRPASWQGIPETTGAFFKALKSLSESKGLIPQEYAQLLERACRQEVPPVESQSATGDSVLTSPIQSYTPEGSGFAIKTKEEHKTIRRIRPPSRDTASRSGPCDGNNADNHLRKISPTASNTPISDPGKSTLRVTPTVATFSQDMVNYQPLERLPTPPVKTDIISLASMSSALEPPGLTPFLQNEPFPIREPHSTPTELTQRDSKNSLTPPSKSAARIAANLAREKSSLGTASEAVSLQPQGNELFLLYANVTPDFNLFAENGSINICAIYTTSSEEAKPEIHLEVPTPTSITPSLTPLSETEPISIREPHPTPMDVEQKDLQNALTPPPKTLSAASTPGGGYKTPDGSPVRAVISSVNKIVEKAKSSQEPIRGHTEKDVEEDVKIRSVIQEVAEDPHQWM